MSGIFLNYRREDTSGYARGVVDRLRERFGTDHVFMDVDRIEPESILWMRLKPAWIIATPCWF